MLRRKIIPVKTAERYMRYAILIALAQLCMSACGSSQPDIYGVKGIVISGVKSDGGTITIAFDAMPESLYYCGSVKVEEEADKITLYFERYEFDGRGGKVLREIKVNNPQLKPVRIGDTKGIFVGVWEKPSSNDDNNMGQPTLSPAPK